MSELPSKGARVIKIKPKVDWPGLIESTELFNGETMFHIRFDDPGLDDELLYRDDFIMEPLPIPKAKSVLIFPNGNAAVCDENGEQIPPLQGSWINFDYLKKLARAIASDAPEVEIAHLPAVVGIHLKEYIEYYKKYPEAEA